MLTLLFVFVKGGMGALAVTRPQSGVVMALQMGFSLIAFASSLMLAPGRNGGISQKKEIILRGRE